MYKLKLHPNVKWCYLIKFKYLSALFVILESHSILQFSLIRQNQGPYAKWKVMKFKLSHRKSWKNHEMQYQSWKVMEKSWNIKYYKLCGFIQLYIFQVKTLISLN